MARGIAEFEASLGMVWIQHTRVRLREKCLELRVVHLLGALAKERTCAAWGDGAPEQPTGAAGQAKRCA